MWNAELRTDRTKGRIVQGEMVSSIYNGRGDDECRHDATFQRGGISQGEASRQEQRRY